MCAGSLGGKPPLIKGCVSCVLRCVLERAKRRGSDVMQGRLDGHPIQSWSWVFGSKTWGGPSGVIRTDDTAVQIRRGPGGEIGWAGSSIWALNCRMVVEREKDRPSHSHLT